MTQFPRRAIIAAGAATAAGTALAATPGNPDEPPQGAVNAKGPGSTSDPGPQNPAITGQFPAAFSPPPTDIGDLPQFWASFNNAPRRIQDGGWARQVTQSDFQISEEISGVNMRLAAGGIRELHWHQAAEWGYMTYGACRVTVLDAEGRAYVADTKAGDLWYFPAGFPHSLQGLGPDGCEFILCFDSGKQSEYNTLLVSDWMAHTPLDVLALNFGVPAETFSKIPLHDLWIFQGTVPGTLAADRDAVRGQAGMPLNPFTYSLADGPVTKKTRGGKVQVADSSNFKASTTIAAALVTVHPGGMREMHWHPAAAAGDRRGRLSLLLQPPRRPDVRADLAPLPDQEHAGHHQPPLCRVARGVPQRRLRRFVDRPPRPQRRDHRHRRRVLPAQGGPRTHRAARPPTPQS